MKKYNQSYVTLACFVVAASQANTAISQTEIEHVQEWQLPSHIMPAEFTSSLTRYFDQLSYSNRARKKLPRSIQKSSVPSPVDPMLQSSVVILDSYSDMVDLRTNYTSSNSIRVGGHGQWFEYTGNGNSNNYTHYDASMTVNSSGAVSVSVQPNRIPSLMRGAMDERRLFVANLSVYHINAGERILRKQTTVEFMGEWGGDGNSFQQSADDYAVDGQHDYEAVLSVVTEGVEKSIVIRFSHFKERDNLEWSSDMIDLRVVNISDDGVIVYGHGQWFDCTGNGNSNNYTHYDANLRVSAESGTIQANIDPNWFIASDCRKTYESRLFKATIQVYQMDSDERILVYTDNIEWYGEWGIDDASLSARKIDYGSLGINKYEAVLQVETGDIQKNITIQFESEY